MSDSFPKSATPFDVFLMHITGKGIDTRTKAKEIYNTLQAADIAVLSDDFNERAGVKFNNKAMSGCPMRITVGENNLKEGTVELKPRKADKNLIFPQSDIISKIREIF